ncbi:MAG: helix-hairpin-helix domain-containing protein [Saprospiraceae bacterium]|nr:helix-hairpin-helix domain-containing protein [Saprospiraceae bacterium]
MNSADSVQWVQLKGIGPYLSSKILKYRKRLGGFIYKKQLLESDIITDSLYHTLEPLLTLNNLELSKINLNTADYRTFINHPYFNSETIQAILKYRKQHGPFADPTHIRRIKSLKEEIGKKILPYLTVN